MMTEISVHIPNLPGQLARVLKALAEGEVNICGLTIEPVGMDYSIVRMICYPLERAREQLYKYAYGISESQILAMPLEHESGALSKIAQLLSTNDINIQYGGFLTLHVGTDKVIVFIHSNNDEKAQELLIRNGYENLDNEDLEFLPKKLS